jgi:hypothetical protein
MGNGGQCSLAPLPPTPLQLHLYRGITLRRLGVAVFQPAHVRCGTRPGSHMYETPIVFLAALINVLPSLHPASRCHDVFLSPLQ